MADPTPDPEVTREDVLAACQEANAEADYTTIADRNEAIYKVIEKHVARSTKDRASIAIDKDALMARIYPLVPAASEWGQESNPRLAELTYKELRKHVWATTTPINGRMQELLAERNGHVLCRVGGMRGNSVYITKDADCFRIDTIEPRGSDDVTRTTKVAKFYGQVSKRVPGMAPVIAEAFDGQLKELVAAARAHVPMLLAQHSAVDDLDGESDDDE